MDVQDECAMRKKENYISWTHNGGARAAWTIQDEMDL